MKYVCSCLFVFFTTALFAQDKATSESIYGIMDANAEFLLKDSGAYSVSVGIVKDGKVYTRHYGEIDKGKGNKATDDTYFEAASVTKVMTGYLLAQAVLEGKVRLGDDIRKYLKQAYPNLEYAGKPITFKDLIHFQSGIPNILPDDRDIRKIQDDSTSFRANDLLDRYSKAQFLSDLKKVKLDTLPGTKFLYSNPSLELSGLLLENIYGKNFEALIKRNVWRKLGMSHTKFDLGKNEFLANGYNQNHVLMPHFKNHLWGAAGARTKSTLADLMKLLQFELDPKNAAVRESQRVVDPNKFDWFGYFWDGVATTEYGKFCFKHGGAFGNQLLFSVFPEQRLGICLIVNISGPETFGSLFNANFSMAGDLLTASHAKQVFGYAIQGENVVFRYQHPNGADADLIRKITVAGSFNGWSDSAKGFEMVAKGNGLYELSIPKARFENGKVCEFKFVINGKHWMNAPKFASNVSASPDLNLTMRID